jgi:CheY-like chemotaxis protein
MPRVQSDPLLLHQVFLNIMMNAEQSIAATGKPGRIEISSTRADDRVITSVRDTGSGIPEEALSRIFEPFYTTKEVGKGSGLGLAQVWGFVTQSGGHIAVESVLGRGTIFSLLLPLTDMAPAVAPKVETLPRLQRGAETILVVEDDNDVRAMTAATLEELGYKTIIAQDGPQALAALGTGETVDLLFSDYVMPGMSGAELARAASEQRPGLKILLTSGYAKHAQLGDGDSADGFPLLAKPYRVDELAAKIREILERPEAQTTSPH